MATRWRLKIGRDTSERAARSGRRTHLRFDVMEDRQLLATLAPIANQTVGTGVGLQVSLDGGNTNPQTYTVTSSNPALQASIAQGNYLTFTVNHASSGANDPAFTGNIVIKLFQDLTPDTVQHIEQLVTSGFYTSPTQPTAGAPLPNKNFHRVVPNFVVQGGSLTGDGTGSFTAPGFPFPDEFNQQLVFNGIYQIAMANAGDDTNDTQFFITLTDTRTLDYNHTIFGQVVAGTDVVNQMANVARNGDTPVTPILIKGASLSPVNPDGVIHIDATQADIGQTSTVTVTATDPSDNTAVQRTFTVTVTANVNSSGQPVAETPFLQPVPNQVVATNQQAIFQLQGVSPIPNDVLTYTVAGGITGSGSSKSFVPIPATQGTASVDSNGVVTFTPANNFTGIVNLVVGVRNNNLKSGATSVTAVDNFDTQTMTVTVRSGDVVNLAPIALPQTVTVPATVPTPIQLQGQTANPGQPAQTLRYTIASQPTHGTISNFDPATGTFTYTSNPNFFGTDRLQFFVTDTGGPGPSLSSQVATVTLLVGGASLNNVRVLDGVLLISAPARRVGKNTIIVSQSNGRVQVTVNGILALQQPLVSDLDRIVAYGSKASDSIVIDPSITLPATLNGGRGGTNTLQAGGGKTRIHGWFGRNVMAGGDQHDQLIGRQAHVQVRASNGHDLVFLGQGAISQKKGFPAYPTSSWAINPAKPPSGQFYRLIGQKLVPINTPKLRITRRDVVRVGTRNYPRVQN